jgi:ferredoxin/flavodoxin---NADP+ reductase
MPYVITQSCCKDASCTAVCPVDCIHPTLDETAYATAESLYIDSDTCIDCGACVEQCPVDAIVHEDLLPRTQVRYLDIGASYFRNRSAPTPGVHRPAIRAGADLSGIRIAIVGTGPAAMYAVWELLEHRDVQIEMYDRSLAPFGLIRTGVAPDHPDTKAVLKLFERAVRRPNVRMHLGVEVGKHLTHAELAATHSAVIYATGASAERTTGLPGEELNGVHSATAFVGWYNGSPEHADASFDLSGERAVIIGNGNVALDVARILVADPVRLSRTDITDHALKALAENAIREVVILGRRGPAQAAYTSPELLALLDLPDVDVVIDPREAAIDATGHQLADPHADPSSALKADLAAVISARPRTGAAKRIVLRYLSSPTRLCGTDAVESVEIARNSLVCNPDGTVRARSGTESELLTAELVLESVGYQGVEIAGVPFDHDHHLIPNDRGRVLTAPEGTVVPGIYVTGWIKRGPSGVIGSNKQCARETVQRLVLDVGAGVVTPVSDDERLTELLRERCPNAIGFDGWLRVDTAERLAGLKSGKPRVKFVHVEDMRRVALGADSQEEHHLPVDRQSEGSNK